LEINHRIIRALIIRAIKNIIVKKYKIHLPDEVIEEVSRVASEDIMAVKEAYKKIK
jgi:hypothetical protein